jgi:serine/threonine protein kinase
VPEPVRDADTVRFDSDDQIPTADLDLHDVAAIGAAGESQTSPEQDDSVSLEPRHTNRPRTGGEPAKNRRRGGGLLRPNRHIAKPIPAREGPTSRLGPPPVTAEVSDPSLASQSAVQPALAVGASDNANAQAPENSDISTGSVLRDRYVIEHVAGIGGNSVVFQAIDRHRDSLEDRGNRVAVKVLRPALRDNPHALVRMRREFRQMQRLTHHSIARVFDLDCDGDVWFMTLELIEGQTISRWMKGDAPDAEALQIITGCCEAVSYAHSRGIVHGDLKPSNVLVTAAMTIKLVDFGSAAAETTGAAMAVSARSFAATPPYASPQILTGNVADPRDDVFSLACIAYAVLTRGEHPFARKSSLDAFREQLRPTYSPKIQPRVFDVIVRALSWERSHRFASANEFLHALMGNDLGRDTNVEVSRSPDSSLPMPAPVATPPITPPRDGMSMVAAQYPWSSGAIYSLTTTLDIPPSQRYLLPSQWLTFQPWMNGPGYSVTSIDSSRSGEPLHWYKSQAMGTGAAIPTAMARPQAPAIEGELLARTPVVANHVRRQKHYPTIWHRHGLAAVAVIGVLAILLGHESNVGSSTTAAVATTPPPVATTVAASVTAAIDPIAIREITEQPADAIVTPNIVEHVVPPPPPPPVRSAPGFVSFDAETVHVGGGQSMAVLTVKRLDSTRGRARVGWTVEGASARAVVDGSAIDSQTIQFLDGQEVRSLYIPLLTPAHPGDHQPTRSFIVKLKKLEGSPAVGPVTQAKVMIASGY